MSTTERIIRQLSALDTVGSLDEKRWPTFTDVGKVIRPTIRKKDPAPALRASYDVRSRWHTATRSA